MPSDDLPSTVLDAGDAAFVREVTVYLEVLGNPTRLKVLSLISQRPMDTHTIAAAVATSYENTKQHLEKLLRIGVVTRRAGIGRETTTGAHPVWEYLPVPGAMERILRDLAVFGTEVHEGKSETTVRVAALRSKIAGEINPGLPLLVVIGGESDGLIVPLQGETLMLGRADQGRFSWEAGSGTLAFPPSYRAVTRIIGPHGWFRRRGSALTVEDAGSTGGIFLNGRRVPACGEIPVHDGDLVAFSLGAMGALVLVVEPLKTHLYEGDRQP
jgi:DNA-binding transcriptional ArsR family regulator